MAEGKKSVLLYCDIIHTVKELSDDEAGRLFKHYLEYINDLNPTPPDKLTQIVFEPIKQNLKRDLKKWEVKSERNSVIAKEGWVKRKQANASERIKPDANNADKVTVTVKVTDKDIINVEKEFLESPSWIEQTAMFLKVPIVWVKGNMSSFIQEKKLKCDIEKEGIEEVRRHFLNWAKKQEKPKTLKAL